MSVEAKTKFAMHKFEKVSIVQPSILKTPTSLDGKSKKKKKKAATQPTTP